MLKKITDLVGFRAAKLGGGEVAKWGWLKAVTLICSVFSVDTEYSAASWELGCYFSACFVQMTTQLARAKLLTCLLVSKHLLIVFFC